MRNTDKELAQLATEEKKLLEQQKAERDALKKRLAAVKKQIREEERKLNERRAELVGHCMMQKFSSDPEAKEAMLLGSRWFPVEAGRPGTVRTAPKIDSCKRSLLKLFRSLSLFQDRRPYASVGGGCSQYPWQPRSSGVASERQTVFGTLDDGCRTGMAQDQGTEWHRVRQSQAVRSAVLYLIDGPDFDCVNVKVWPARYCLESGMRLTQQPLLGARYSSWVPPAPWRTRFKIGSRVRMAMSRLSLAGPGARYDPKVCVVGSSVYRSCRGVRRR